MAYLGCGFYKKKIPLRAFGVFPTWDRLSFRRGAKAVGIESLERHQKTEISGARLDAPARQAANHDLRYRRMPKPTA